MATDDPRPETLGSLFVLSQLLGHHLDTALGPFGLTSRQWLLLAVLERRFGGRPPTLTDAAAAYGTSRQNVKAIAEGLERRGWVRLEPDAADRRATRIAVTDAVGRFHEPDAEATGRALLASSFAGLTTPEVAALRDLVARMTLGLQAPAEAAR